MISFQELMQKYYSDPKSGIRNEEAPTNSTGPAIANPDIPLNIKKKKKDMTYDGRQVHRHHDQRGARLALRRSVRRSRRAL